MLIGIYSNQQLIGQAPGETSEIAGKNLRKIKKNIYVYLKTNLKIIAEEMAVLDALKRIFRFDESSSKPLPFGRETQQMKAKKSNLTIEQWKSSNINNV